MSNLSGVLQYLLFTRDFKKFNKDSTPIVPFLTQNRIPIKASHSEWGSHINQNLKYRLWGTNQHKTPRGLIFSKTILKVKICLVWLYFNFLPPPTRLFHISPKSQPNGSIKQWHFSKNTNSIHSKVKMKNRPCWWWRSSRLEPSCLAPSWSSSLPRRGGMTRRSAVRSFSDFLRI